MYDGRPRGFSARDIDCDAYGNGVAASWYGFASALPMDHYEWAVGTSPGATDVQPFIAVGLSATAVNETLFPPPGAVVYATVKAVNVAGLSVTASSDGVRILCPPTGAAIKPITILVPDTGLTGNATSAASINATTLPAGAVIELPAPTCTSDGEGFVCLSLDGDAATALPAGLGFLTA